MFLYALICWIFFDYRRNLGAQYSKDSGDGCGLPHSPPSPCATPQSTLWLPGHYPFLGPQVGTEHQLLHQESTTEDVLPVAAEEVQPAKDNDGELLLQSQIS